MFHMNEIDEGVGSLSNEVFAICKIGSFIVRFSFFI